MNKEEFLKGDGVYEREGVIWIHLSPIPNWYHILKGLEFVCPFCDAKRKFDYHNDKTAEYGHRWVVWTCKCNQKFGVENYDEYLGEK